MRHVYVLLVLATGLMENAVAQEWSCYVDSTMPEGGSQAEDCLPNFTYPGPYTPGASAPLYRIPVVFHLILRDSLGTGDLPDDSLAAQINRLNEDYLAIPGTPGSASLNTRIMFYLTSLDSIGNSTTGIERVVNQAWYDSGSVALYGNPGREAEMCNALNWDPDRFLNVYTITPSLGGGATNFPWLVAGAPRDGVRIGQDHVAGAYFRGRVLVHEIGHMLGLWHNFDHNSCNLDCYNDGDYLCDTPPSQPGYFGHPCSFRSTMPCDPPYEYRAPFNHMEYARDSCRTYFTAEQAGRMRCVMPSYRAALYDSIVVTTTPNTPAKNFWLTCPQGDASLSADPYIVTVDFANAGMRRNVTPQEIGLVPSTSTLYKFWRTADIIADSAATSANGYQTTVTHRMIGGCASDSETVYLNGVALKKVFFSSRSYDFHPSSPGIVDASDLSVLSASLDKCDTIPGYNACVDFIVAGSSARCVDASDVSAFAAHLGHHKPEGAYKSLVTTTGVRFIDDRLPDGGLQVGVDLENVDDLCVFGLVLRPDGQELGQATWAQDSDLGAAQTFLFQFQDQQGPKLVLLVMNAGSTSAAQLRLGTLTFPSPTEGANSAEHLRIEYAEGASADGNAWAASRAGKPNEPPRNAWVDRLEQNYPNPFKPMTVLQYSVAREVHVRLAVYNVQGQLVRILVDGPQQPNAYRVVWDGKDGHGRAVGNGIYVTRLTVGGFHHSRKLVLLR